jgi:hypothetical protein
MFTKVDILDGGPPRRFARGETTPRRRAFGTPAFLGLESAFIGFCAREKTRKADK